MRILYFVYGMTKLKIPVLIFLILSALGGGGEAKVSMQYFISNKKFLIFLLLVLSEMAC